MIKLLVLTPAGDQKVEEVSESGYYFDQSRVLWDERKDGPLDQSIIDSGLGGIVRVGKDLQIDPTAKESYDTRKELEAQAKEAIEIEKIEIADRLKSVRTIKSLAEAETIILDILKHLKLQ